MDFDSYIIVFLVSGPNRESAGQTELQQIQDRHLAHLEKLHRDGYALVAGPFAEQSDPAFRGLVIFRGDLPIGKAIELAGDDPAVRAGRLAVQAVRWYCHRDFVRFPHSPGSQETASE